MGEGQEMAGGSVRSNRMDADCSLTVHGGLVCINIR